MVFKNSQQLVLYLMYTTPVFSCWPRREVSYLLHSLVVHCFLCAFSHALILVWNFYVVIIILFLSITLTFLQGSVEAMTAFCEINPNNQFFSLLMWISTALFWVGVPLVGLWCPGYCRKGWVHSGDLLNWATSGHYYVEDMWKGLNLGINTQVSYKYKEYEICLPRQWNILQVMITSPPA